LQPPDPFGIRRIRKDLFTPLKTDRTLSYSSPREPPEENMVKYAFLLILALLLASVFYFHQKAAQMESLVVSLEDENNTLRLALQQRPDETDRQGAVEESAPPASNIVLTVTAYTAPPSKHHPKKKQVKKRLTASGAKPIRGAIAVSRDLFEQGWGFGKKVYIRDHGLFTITDLMHSRITRTIDIYMDKKEEAIQFGKKQLEVLLLDV